VERQIRHAESDRPYTTSTLSPSSRQVPGLCRGSSQSGVARSAIRRTRAQRVLLTVSFRGDRIARREEDGPAALAIEVTSVRDGGDRLAAGAGERRGGSSPRRCAAALEAAGQAAAPQRRDSRHPAANDAALSTVHVIPRVIYAPLLRVRPGPDGLARRRRALEALRRESCHSSGSQLTVLRRVMRDTRLPTDPRQSKARTAAMSGKSVEPRHRPAYGCRDWPTWR
jgi:hypothetical protein